MIFCIFLEARLRLQRVISRLQPALLDSLLLLDKVRYMFFKIASCWTTFTQFLRVLMLFLRHHHLIIVPLFQAIFFAVSLDAYNMMVLVLIGGIYWVQSST
jgi:hypothetical protein